MTRTEYRRGSDVRERIVDTIVASRVQSGILKDRRQIKLYLSQYFAHVPYEDLQGLVEKIMARVALDHLEFGATRKKGQPLVRFFNPTVETHGYESAFSFIEMVNDVHSWCPHEFGYCLQGTRGCFEFDREAILGQAVKLVGSLKRAARGWLTGWATRKVEAATAEIGANGAKRGTTGPR